MNIQKAKNSNAFISIFISLWLSFEIENMLLHTMKWFQGSQKFLMQNYSFQKFCPIRTFILAYFWLHYHIWHSIKWFELSHPFFISNFLNTLRKLLNWFKFKAVTLQPINIYNCHHFFINLLRYFRYSKVELLFS